MKKKKETDKIEKGEKEGSDAADGEISETRECAKEVGCR